MKMKLFLLVAFSLLMASFASAAYQTCTFDNTIAHVNCNAYKAGDSFCYFAMGAIANNPATATQCNSSTVVCGMNVTTNQTIRCSNTPSYVSGPDLQANAGLGTTGSSGKSCPYNDCEQNQIGCSGGYSYMLCDDYDGDGCNEWKTFMCEGGKACYNPTSCSPYPTEVRNDLPGGPTFVKKPSTPPSNPPQPVAELSIDIDKSPKQSLQDFFKSEMVQSLFGNERINVTILMDDGSVINVGIVTKDGVVQEFVQPSVEKPTVNVRATEKALVAIYNSSNKTFELNNQMKVGGIKYEAIDPITGIKLFVVGFISSIVSIFSG